MVVDPTVVADSAPVAETAPSVAVEAPDATHGEQTDQSTPVDTDADTAETPPSTDGDDADPDLQPTDSDTEEEAKTKSEKRRERRQAREQKRIDDAVEERFAAREAERTAKAAQEASEAKTKKAAEDFYQEFGSFVGSPETRTSLVQDISALTSEVTQLRPYAQGTDLDALEAKQEALSAKIAELDRLNANQSTYDKLDAFQFRLTQNQYVQAGSELPKEFQGQLLGARDVPGALKAIKEGYIALGRSQEAAVKDKEIAEWKGKYEKEAASHEATRTGAPGSGPAPQGQNGGGVSGSMTRAEFLALPKERRDHIRRENPGALAAIYERSA